MQSVEYVSELKPFERRILQLIKERDALLPDPVSTEHIAEVVEGKAIAIGSDRMRKYAWAISRVMWLAGWEPLYNGDKRYREAYRDDHGNRSASNWWCRRAI